MIKGIAASNGIVIGKAFVVSDAKPKLPRYDISPNQKDQELARLNRAMTKTKKQLEDIRANLAAKTGEEEAAIFDAHLMLLEDPMLAEAITEKISQGCNAEAAVYDASETFACMFDAMDDEYMRSRAADVRDIRSHWVNNLLGVDIRTLVNMTQPAVVFAHDLAPSDTAQMDKTMVLAFVTKIGGRTSHSVIMARSLEIPAVVGVGEFGDVVPGDTVIVDGGTGQVIINPQPAVLADYQSRKQKQEELRAQLRELKDLPAQTKDGKTFELVANIGTPNDAEKALAYGAQGVGLYRTEFLYMDRKDMPSEEEQYLAYRQVLEAFGQKPVIIRTLDIGGDKELTYLKIGQELNPFLGNRAIRLCLANPEMFKVQLRAILRAGVTGNPWIMLPMVAILEEVRRTKELLREVEAELEAEGAEFTRHYKLGIMIEVPAAAVQADHFAQEVDFFSIGTNDLIQYTCAADRMNQNVSYLYEPFNPAVLRLIEQVICAGHKYGKFVGMCGEMAGEPLAAPLLMAMGLDEFSMSASSIPLVKEVIRSLDTGRCRELLGQAQKFTDGKEIRQLLEEELKDIL
jgi:phosphotransferase system enzyme I (PtsI)